ncbi:MAG: hypothetical protein WCK77_15965 [Verrucomicrobiota bacterium]
MTAAHARESLAFTTFAIMTRVGSTAGSATICEISETLDLPYHTILHQVHRTPWLEFDRSAERVRPGLNETGLRKMARMEQRLARKPIPAATTPPPPSPSASVLRSQPATTKGGT